MANQSNLRPPFSPSEAREMGKKGAKASVKSRRKRKKMKEDLLALLSLPSEKREGSSRQLSMLIAQIEKAENGDKDAAIFVRDTIGEKPTDKLNVDGKIVFGWEEWLAEAEKEGKQL